MAPRPKYHIPKEELEEYYLNQKLSHNEIAKIFNCSRKIISIRMKKYGIPQRSLEEANQLKASKKRGFEITFDMVKKHLDDGLFIYQIADMYGVNSKTINAITIKAGLKLANDEYRREHSRRITKELNLHENFRPSLDRKVEEAEAAWEFAHLKDLHTYRKIAGHIAYRHYNRGADVPDGYEIDHKFPVTKAWELGVPVKIISHPYNLHLVPWIENRQKRDNPLITLEELYNGTKENS